MVLQEYQHDNHGMIVTNMFQTSWTGAAKVPHMFRNFMGTGVARVPARVMPTTCPRCLGP